MRGFRSLTPSPRGVRLGPWRVWVCGPTARPSAPRLGHVGRFGGARKTGPMRFWEGSSSRAPWDGRAALARLPKPHTFAPGRETRPVARMGVWADRPALSTSFGARGALWRRSQDRTYEVLGTLVHKLPYTTNKHTGRYRSSTAARPARSGSVDRPIYQVVADPHSSTEHTRTDGHKLASRADVQRTDKQRYHSCAQLSFSRHNAIGRHQIAHKTSHSFRIDHSIDFCSKRFSSTAVHAHSEVSASRQRARSTASQAHLRAQSTCPARRGAIESAAVAGNATFKRWANSRFPSATEAFLVRRISRGACTNVSHGAGRAVA